MMGKIARFLMSVVFILSVFPPPGMAALPVSAGSPLQPSAETGFRLLSSGESVIEVAYTLPAVSVDRVTAGSLDCDRISAIGLAAGGEAGAPAVPSAVTLLSVPAQGGLTLSVETSSVEDLPGSYRLCPNPTLELAALDLEAPQTPQEQYRMAPEQYQAAGFAPSAAASIVDQGYLRSLSVARLRVNPVQYDASTGTVRLIHSIRARLSFDSRALAQLAAPSPASEADLKLFGALLLNPSDASRFSPAARPTVLSAQAPASGPAYKLVIPADGMYEVTYEDLDLAEAPVGEINPSNVHIVRRGVELPLLFLGDADAQLEPGERFLFYGKALESYFSAEDVYLLTWDDTPGLRMAAAAAAPQAGFDDALEVIEQRHFEQNYKYAMNLPSGDNYDHWYWDFITISKALPPPPNPPKPDDVREYKVSLSNPKTDSATPAVLRGFLKGFTARLQHHIFVKVNGTQVAELTWPSTAEKLFTVSISPSILKHGENTISLVIPQYDGNTIEYFYVNWFEIDYPRQLAADHNVFAFSSTPGQAAYHIAGFAAEDVELFDITDPLNPVAITGLDVIPENGAYTLRYESSDSAPRRYLAQVPGGRIKLARPALLPAAVLKSPENEADYLVLTHASLLDAAQELADYRAGQGLRVKVVDLQTIYDEFAGGLPDPRAIHDFLAYAYQNWRPPAPLYVLLLGDGHYDYRGYLNTGEINFVPPLMARDPWIGNTASDNAYATIFGADLLPDLLVGRLPVKTPGEAHAMIQKIIAYESAPVEDWNKRALFVADQTDRTLVFSDSADTLASSLPAGYSAGKMYYMNTHLTPAAARAAILQEINAGAGLVMYVGHAAVQIWSGASLFTVDSVPLLQNGAKQPFFMSLDCVDGYFIHPSKPGANLNSLAETVVRAPAQITLPDGSTGPGGGGIAAFVPSGYGTVDGHDVLAAGLFEAIFEAGLNRAGAATAYAKYYLMSHSLGYDSLVETFNLLGDPALQLKLGPAGDPPLADVSVTAALQTPGPIRVGQEVDILISYANLGGAPAQNVTLSLEGIFGFEILSSTADAALHANAGHLNSWSRLSLAGGESGSVLIHARASRSLADQNTLIARAASASTDADPVNNAASLAFAAVPYRLTLPYLTVGSALMP